MCDNVLLFIFSFLHVFFFLLVFFFVFTASCRRYTPSELASATNNICSVFPMFKMSYLITAFSCGYFAINPGCTEKVARLLAVSERVEGFNKTLPSYMLRLTQPAHSTFNSFFEDHDIVWFSLAFLDGAPDVYLCGTAEVTQGFLERWVHGLDSVFGKNDSSSSLCRRAFSCSRTRRLWQIV